MVSRDSLDLRAARASAAGTGERSERVKRDRTAHRSSGRF